MSISVTPVMADDLTILFPSSKSRISHAPSGLLKILYESSEAREFYLLKTDSITISANIESSEDRENFPQILFESYFSGFHAGTMILKFFRQDVETDVFEYNFSTNRPLNLEDFWKTTDFRRVLAKVNESNAQSLELRLIGWKAQSWLLNDQSQPNHMDMIGSSVNLTPGNNTYTIQVRDVNYELILEDTLNYYYYVSNIADSPLAGFERKQFHLEENEPQCSLCHQEIVENECAFCHASVQSQEFVHSPVEDMECNTCHDDEEYPKNELLEDFQEDPEACLACHSDVEDHIGEVENVHPPLDESCVICHDPHSSPYPFMLTTKTRTLCETCHEDIEEGFHPVSNHPLEGEADPRREDRAFNCASCHNPHGSDEDYLLREEWIPMCDQCHVKN